jgi:hypothetical protein
MASLSQPSVCTGKLRPRRATLQARFAAPLRASETNIHASHVTELHPDKAQESGDPVGMICVASW